MMPPECTNVSEHYNLSCQSVFSNHSHSYAYISNVLHPSNNVLWSPCWWRLFSVCAMCALGVRLSGSSVVLAGVFAVFHLRIHSDVMESSSVEDCDSYLRCLINEIYGG